MRTTAALERLRAGLVVSCQAYPGEPMRRPEVMTAVAQAAVIGGAVGIRAQGLADLASIRAAVDVPLIGLVKVGDAGVFITPTVADAAAVARTGAQLVALDGTRRPRPDGRPLRDSIEEIHAAGALAMADCGCLEDALAAVAAGADCVGTTLAGYTGDRPTTPGPDLELLRALVAAVAVPVIAEGRVRTPADARACLDAGGVRRRRGDRDHPSEQHHRELRRGAVTEPDPATHWAPGAAGVIALPGGVAVRGRSVRRPVPPGPLPTYGLYLTGLRPPATSWPQRWVRWPDFGLPIRFGAAAQALLDAYDAAAGAPPGRVELGCGGGRGRTGTGLAALAVCAGLPPAEAIALVRSGYDARAVETPWQRWYVGWFARWLARGSSRRPQPGSPPRSG